MKNFLKKPKQIFQDLMQLDAREKNLLLYNVIPNIFLDGLHKYFRMEIEGIENIPKRGPALIIPNHSGFAGFDALMLAHEINRNCHRIPRVLTHHFWFLTELLASTANKVGFIEANMKNGIEQLNKNNLVVIFPEGEGGNFKASSKRYHLQEFKRGFIRMALEAQCPIVPTLIIGAEETNFNIRRLKFFRNTILPLPLNILPLPARWKIKFLAPVKLPYQKSALQNEELITEIAEEIRESMQNALAEELVKRKSIYF
jgi:1-acyl-sn-glycerol-3-phosphate acyltransferase